MILGMKYVLRSSTRWMSSIVDPKPILSLIDGYRCSKVLFTAVNMKIFDHLTSRSLSLDELAEKLNVKHLSALERCLNACVALKLLHREKSNEKYSNTKLSETYLVSTSPMTLNGYIDHNNQSSIFLWNHLSDAIREEAPQWKRTFEKMNQEGTFTFNSFYRDETAEVIFMSGMHGLGLTTFPSVVGCLDDIKQYQIICDVGGGTGGLAISACQVNPQLRAIIFDLPKIEKHAIRYVNQTAGDIRQRIRFESGDFFRDPLPEADLFSLGRILHDWKDEQCEKLLTKIYQRLPERNGAILIGEKLLNDEKTGPVEVNMQDINMLLSTAGKERSAKEFTTMLENVGFKNIKCEKTGTYLDAIIAYK